MLYNKKIMSGFNRWGKSSLSILSLLLIILANNLYGASFEPSFVRSPLADVPASYTEHIPSSAHSYLLTPFVFESQNNGSENSEPDENDAEEFDGFIVHESYFKASLHSPFEINWANAFTLFIPQKNSKLYLLYSNLKIFSEHIL